MQDVLCYKHIMNDVTPEWIKKLKAEDEQRENDAAESSLAEINDSLRINAEAPKFWKQLLKELKINVDSLGELGIRGVMSPIESNNGCHILVARIGTAPKQTYINVFYSENPTRIRLRTDAGEEQLPFGVCDGAVYVTSQLPPFSSMAEEQTAEYIVKRLVDWIRK